MKDTKNKRNARSGSAGHGSGRSGQKSKHSFGGPQARGQKPHSPFSLPEVVVCAVDHIDVDGEAICFPVKWDESKNGRPPKIYLQPNTGHTALNVGDHALLRLKRLTPRTYSATVLRKLEHGKAARIVALYQETTEGGRLVPTDRRQKDEVSIKPEDKGEAKHGDLVLAEIMQGTASMGLPRGKVIEALGPATASKAISLIAIHTHEIPNHFPEDVIQQAEACPRPTLGKRTDLRDIPLVTIDGLDARDFDDAVYAEPDGDGWKLLVAIADVSAYVTPGSPLDQEAYRRGNSTYFPDRVVPMLPEALSNDLCSLRPHEDRACLACWLWVNAAGRLTRYEFVRGLMKSRARLTYEQVQMAHDGALDATTAPLLDTVITPLYGAYHTLLRAREKRGTLDLNISERKVEIDPTTGQVAAIRPRVRLDSHKLIEEFMILANVAAAQALEAKSAPCVYRIHEPPAASRLEALRLFLKPLGFGLPQGERIEPRNFAKLLEETADNPLSELISTVILRTQSQAQYNPDNCGHFGLALVSYAHFTSPIRRYADLVVHRALIRAYDLGEGGITASEVEHLAEISTHISSTERRSALAERDATDRYTALYLSEHVGASFTGRVSGVTRFGMFIALDETGADGLVPMHSLHDDRYEHDETHHCLIGKRWGRVFRLGARCRVKVLAADSLQGSTLFQLLEIEEPAEEWPPSNRRSAKFKRGKLAKTLGKRTAAPAKDEKAKQPAQKNDRAKGDHAKGSSGSGSGTAQPVAKKPASRRAGGKPKRK